MALVKLFFLLFPALAWAEYRGISELGLCHPRNKWGQVKKQFSGAPVIVTGWLDNTFNAAGCPNAQKLMLSPKKKIVRVHIMNGPGLRNKRLEPHEIHFGYTKSGLDKKIRQRNPEFLARYIGRLEAVRAITDTHRGKLKLYLSPCLECDFSKPARKVLLEQAGLVFPEATLVDNPLKGSCVSGVLCERHGPDKRGDIVDLDGISLDVVNVKKWAKTVRPVRLRYAWKPCNNGLKQGQKWLPPTKRKNFCKAEDRAQFRAFLKGEL